MKALPQFNGIGSDPEFLFVTKQDFRPVTVAASTVITSNKVLALKSFIGTDNHAATAELRPGPAHNVGRHLYDIAYGLHETDKWLSTQKKYAETRIVAQPYVNEEPLGGHVHCSFFLDEPETQTITALNRVYRQDRFTIFDVEQPAPQLTPEHIKMFQAYSQKFHEQKLFTSSDFTYGLDYLLLPFECAIQPWYDRQRRNGRYGGVTGIGDRVRQNVSYPKSSKANKFAYLHYEYRVPSTWLCHPWLAYSYLGLAKLCMLNFKEIWGDQNSSMPRETDKPSNGVYQKIFQERFNRLMKCGRCSNDLKSLVEIIPKCFETRAAWFEVPAQSIDIDAWRRLL